jgi:hypothetical protein
LNNVQSPVCDVLSIDGTALAAAVRRSKDAGADDGREA